MSLIRILIFASIISACNGGGGGGAGGGGASSGSSGSSVTMVDPYIEGATMCYDSNNNNFCDPDEPESSPSDSKGKTQFAITLPNEARLIQKEKGFSLGKPFLGTLKTEYDPVLNFATPITTLLANGVSEENIVSAINSASGAIGPAALTIADLKRNPMEAVEKNLDDKLDLLKASMAVTALLAENPNLAEIPDTFNQKFSNIDHVIGDSVPDQSKLKAAVVVQELMSFNPVVTIDQDIVSSLILAINNPLNSGKEIKLTIGDGGSITPQALDVPAPSIVRTLNNASLFNTAPEITVGGIKAGDKIQLFSNHTCSIGLGNEVIATSNQVKITPPVEGLSNNSLNKIYAKVMNEGIQTSCSSAFAAFTLDTVTPLAPDSNTTDQESPSNVATFNITFNGAFVQFDEYRLFKDASCTQLVASKMIGHNETSSFSMSTTLTHGSYDFYLKAYDLAGNATGCVDLAKNHVVDLIAPLIPTSVARISPSSSPNKNKALSIAVSGVETGATADLFNGPSCLGSVQASSSTAENNIVTFNLSDLADGVYTYSANVRDLAGNISSCRAANFSHVIDNQKSATPTLSLVSPVSTKNKTRALTLRVSNAEVTDTVKLFSDSGCTTQIASSLAISNVVNFNISIDPDAADGDFTYYARSIDLAANDSDCSAAVSYTLDTTNAVISNIAVSTDNASVDSAKVGDSITVNFTSNEELDLTKSKVKFAGRAASVSNNSEYNYQANLTVLSNDPEGNFSFVIEAHDIAGNITNQASELSNVAIDRTAPIKPSYVKTYPIKSTQATGSIEVDSTNIVSDAIKLEYFSDSGCTQNLKTKVIASNTDKSIIDLPQQGSYTLYSKLEDRTGNVSACYNTNISYTFSRAIAPGLASIGIPMEFAKVTVIGKDGCKKSTRANQNGVFSFTNLDNCQGPYLFRAQNVYATYHAIAAEEDLAAGVKINPITEFISLRAYNAGSASFRDWIGEEDPFYGISNQAMFTALETEQSNVSTYFSSLKSALGVGSSDMRFISGTQFENMLTVLDVEQKDANPESSDHKFVFTIKGSEISSDAPISGALTAWTIPNSGRGLIDHIGEIANVKTKFSSFVECHVISQAKGNIPEWINQAEEEVNASAIRTCLGNHVNEDDFLFMRHDIDDYAAGIGFDYLDEGFMFLYRKPHIADFKIVDGKLEMTLVSQEISKHAQTGMEFPFLVSNFILKKATSGQDQNWKIYGDNTTIDFDFFPINYKQNAESSGHRGFRVYVYDLHDLSSNLDVLDITFANIFDRNIYQLVNVMPNNNMFYNEIMVEDGNSIADCHSKECLSFLEIPSSTKRMNQTLKVNLSALAIANHQAASSFTFFTPAPSIEVDDEDFPSVAYKISDTHVSTSLSGFNLCQDIEAKYNDFDVPEAMVEGEPSSVFYWWGVNIANPAQKIIISHNADQVLTRSDIGRTSSVGVIGINNGLKLEPDYDKLREFNLINWYNDNVPLIDNKYQISRDIHYFLSYRDSTPTNTNGPDRIIGDDYVSFPFNHYEINHTASDKGGVQFTKTYSCRPQ